MIYVFNTYSIKQPDLYYFETKNDVTSLVKFCMEKYEPQAKNSL